MKLLLWIPFVVLFYLSQDPALASEGATGDKEDTLVNKIETVKGYSGSNFGLGISWQQTFFMHTRDKNLADGSIAQAYLTDGGALAPTIRYNSEEKYFYVLDLPKGGLYVGYNLVGQYSTFQANKIVTGHNSTGDNSTIQGEYLFITPLLFARIGPLFDNIRNSFWRAGVGVGAGLVRFEGTMNYQGATTKDSEKIFSRADKVSIATSAIWELQLGDWIILFNSHAIENSTDTGWYNFGSGSMNLIYVFSF